MLFRSEAVGVIKKTLGLQQEQPDWALEQFSRSYLFGGNVEAALDLLNKLVSRGDTSEPVLLRRALALRWLHQSSEAQAAYEVAVKLYPKSGAARAGVVYSMGDQDKLVGALRTADTGLSELPDNPDLLKAKVRVLNWMGHHFEAQKMLDKVPDSMRNDREILEEIGRAHV